MTIAEPETIELAGPLESSPDVAGDGVSRDRLPAAIWVFGGIAIAMLPLAWSYFVWTWRDGHYQYFPLLLAMVAALFVVRFRESQGVATLPRPTLTLLGIAAVVAVTVVGLLLFSGFIGILAAILASWVFTYAATGWGGMRRMAPVLLLLLLAVPLPLGLDDQLIFRMQFLASQLATWLLDGVGVLHVKDGVILITEKARYMTEEACSGVRSLFSSLAVVAVYSVAGRHSGLRLGLNLTQTVMWVVIGNAVRVALTVVLADHVSVWFASGTGHELLSLAVFAFILAMVGSTDWLMGQILTSATNLEWEPETVDVPEPATATDRPISPIRQLMDCGASSLPRTAALTLGPVVMMSVMLSGWVTWVQFAGSSDSQLTGTASSGLASLPNMPIPVEDDLPRQLGQWQRVNYEHTERDGSQLFASNSFAWQFRRGPLVAVVEIDRPWDEWHNLNICYTALGWRSEPRFSLPAPKTSAYPELTHSELVLNKPGQKRGFVLFNAVDANRRDVVPEFRFGGGDRSLTEAIVAQIRLSLGIGNGEANGAVGLVLPISTIQLYSDRTGAYSEEDLESIRQLFFDARDALLASPKWKLQ